MPYWEAASKEVKRLTELFGIQNETSLISLGNRDKSFVWQKYFKKMPLLLGLGCRPYFKHTMKSMNLNHLFASFSDPFFMPMLAHSTKPWVLTIAKDSPNLGSIEKNIQFLQGASHIVVESFRHQELLLQIGLPQEKVSLIHPGIQFDENTPSNKEKPFEILFATAPLGKRDLINRGVYMMIAAAKNLPNIQFTLVWRKKNLEQLNSILADNKITNINVHSGVIKDMTSYYKSCDAVILPAMEYASLKPCPHSGIEGLAQGKPLLVSTPCSLAPLIKDYRAGLVFEPITNALSEAIKKLQTNYDQYQPNCQKLVNEQFSPEVFFKRYHKIYSRLLDQAA